MDGVIMSLAQTALSNGRHLLHHGSFLEEHRFDSLLIRLGSLHVCKKQIKTAACCISSQGAILKESYGTVKCIAQGDC